MTAAKGKFVAQGNSARGLPRAMLLRNAWYIAAWRFRIGFALELRGGGRAAGFTGRVDRWQEFEFVAPSSVLQWTGAADAGTLW